MSRPALSAARVAQLVASINSASRTARVIDPAAGFSYPAMCGGLQSIVTSLVEELAGADAATRVEAAFIQAYKLGGEA